MGMISLSSLMRSEVDNVPNVPTPLLHFKRGATLDDKARAQIVWQGPTVLSSRAITKIVVLLRSIRRLYGDGEHHIVEADRRLSIRLRGSLQIGVIAREGSHASALRSAACL